MSAKLDSRQIITTSANVKRAMLDACAKDIDIAANILTDAVTEAVRRMPNTWPLNLWVDLEIMTVQRSHQLH